VTFEVGGDLIRVYNKGLVSSCYIQSNFTKTSENFKIDVKLEYRPPFGTYRYVGGVTNFDGCGFLRTATEGLPLLRFFNYISKLTTRAAQTLRVAAVLQLCGISVWQLPCGNSA
jgi:hypothetical protein